MVSAFEWFSNPEGAEPEKRERKKKTQFVRSNDGCHKTYVGCPRCTMEWGRAE